MQKYFLSLLVSVLCISTLHASVSQGKEIYTKKCQQCHAYSKAMAGSKDAKEWKRLFAREDDTDILAQTHLKLKEAKTVWDYFEDETYYKEHIHHCFYSQEL